MQTHRSGVHESDPHILRIATGAKEQRGEAINGEAAAVYQQDVDAQHGWGGARRSTLVWISTSSGLPIRQEQDADFGNDGKGHESLYFNWVKH